MSIPPSNPPPGGSYYSAPPPPQSNSGGCWKAVGITCGVLLLLAIIGSVVGVIFVKNQIAHPGGGILGTVVKAGKAGTDGVKIQQAIVRYHDKNGHYPKHLMDLVTDGETDGKLFHSDLDPNPDPAHVSWEYTQPDEGAPGSTPILRQKYTLSVGNSPPQTGSIVINLNGTTGSDNPSHSTSPPEPSSGGSSSN